MSSSSSDDDDDDDDSLVSPPLSLRQCLLFFLVFPRGIRYARNRTGDDDRPGDGDRGVVRHVPLPVQHAEERRFGNDDRSSLLAHSTLSFFLASREVK